MAANELQVGMPAPAFELPNPHEEVIKLNDFRGKWLVLYFYPKDNTPGCTMEALEFTALEDEFSRHNAVILGISPDSCQSHQRFVAKQELTITLLSDPEYQTLEAYGCWQIKNLYGKEFYGVVRTTYLIDPEGKIAEIWPKVKVKGHARAVLDTLKRMV